MRIGKYLILGLLGLIITGNCGNSKDENNTVQKVSVEIDAADYGDMTITKTYSGTLEGARQSFIYASIPERVVSITRPTQFIKMPGTIMKKCRVFIIRKRYRK
jgi:hypothetical protein